MTTLPILFPLPDRDFDVTEVVVPWRLLTRAGHRVVFATERGAVPQADRLLLSGLPFGLGARADASALYRDWEAAPERQHPKHWDELVADDYAALFLAGGHAPGMRQYLGSAELHRFVASFWALQRPVAAICHGVLVLARSIDPASGQSIIRDHRLTCLPKYMERTAYFLTAWRLGRYYRTYPSYVEDEVRAALGAPECFERGPLTLVARGTEQDDAPAFVVTDRHLVTGRWPGDAYLVTKKLLSQIEGRAPRAAQSA